MTCAPRVPLLHCIALLAWCLDDIIMLLAGWEWCHGDQSSSNKRLVIPSVTKLLILRKSVFALGVLREKINTAQVLMVSFPVHAGKTMAALDSLSQSPLPLCQHKSLCIISPTLSRAEPPRPQLRPLFLTRKPISAFYSQLNPFYAPSRFKAFAQCAMRVVIQQEVTEFSHTNTTARFSPRAKLVFISSVFWSRPRCYLPITIRKSWLLPHLAGWASAATLFKIQIRE